MGTHVYIYQYTEHTTLGRMCSSVGATVTAILLFATTAYAQLLGHFSLVQLPEGFQYRDTETVLASEEAARFGLRFYDGGRGRGVNRLSGFGLEIPRFHTEFIDNKIGVKVEDRQIFDRFDSNFLKPLIETRSNKPLKEVLIEFSTPRTRLLPGEGPPPVAAPPARPPNRLINLNQPVRESERSKNSKLGSIYDNHHSSKDSFGLSPNKQLFGETNKKLSKSFFNPGK